MTRIYLPDIVRTIERLNHPNAVEFIDLWCRSNIGHCTLVIQVYAALAAALRELHKAKPKRFTIVEVRKIQAHMLRTMGPHYADKFTVFDAGDTIKVFLHGLVGMDRQPNVETDYAMRHAEFAGVPATIRYRDNIELSVWPDYPRESTGSRAINDNLFMYAKQADGCEHHWMTRRDKFMDKDRLDDIKQMAALHETLAATMRAIKANPLANIGDMAFDEVFNPINPFL